MAWSSDLVEALALAQSRRGPTALVNASLEITQALPAPATAWAWGGRHRLILSVIASEHCAPTAEVWGSACEFSRTHSMSPILDHPPSVGKARIKLASRVASLWSVPLGPSLCWFAFSCLLLCRCLLRQSSSTSASSTQALRDRPRSRHRHPA